MAGTRKFRKDVEALIGCEMAKSHMLSDEDAEKQKEYLSAVRTVENKNKQIEEINQQITALKDLRKGKISKDFASHLSTNILLLEKEIEDCNTAIAEAEVVKRKLRSTVLAIENNASVQIPVRKRA